MINSKNFLTYVPIAIAYTTLCGCLWQLGYWSTFKFNYLEYINISDVFKATIYPFISKMWFYLALMVFPFGLAVGMEFITNKRFDKKDEIIEPRGFRIFLHLTIFLSGTIAFIFSGLIFSSGVSITLFPICTAILIGSLFYKYGVFETQIRDYSLRFMLLIGIALYPALNLVVAKQESIQAKLMFRYKKVDYVIGSDSTMNSIISKAAYLGSTSEFHFFGMSETVLVVKSSEVKILAIRPIIDDQKYKDWLEYRGTIF